MPEDNEEKKASPLLAAWEKGKKLGAFAMMAAALLHSLYATYIMTEDEARAAFKTTTESVAEFSGQVDVRVGVLQGRVDTLEKLVFASHRSERAHFHAAGEIPEVPPEVLPILLEAMALSPELADQLMLEHEAWAESEDAASFAEMEIPKPKKKSAGLKYRPPQAPWEQKVAE